MSICFEDELPEDNPSDFYMTKNDSDIIISERYAILLLLYK